jgi:hypothetical protein
MIDDNEDNVLFSDERTLMATREETIKPAQSVEPASSSRKETIDEVLS